MRKHAFSIGLAFVTLGLALGLSNLRAAPVPISPGIPAANGRYLLEGWNSGTPGNPDYQCFLLDTATGQCWRRTQGRDWEKLPLPPGIEGPTPAEESAK